MVPVLAIPKRLNTDTPKLFSLRKKKKRREVLIKGFNKILTLTVYFVNLSTFFHLGLTLNNRSPQISCPGFFLKKLVLEHLSAIIFSLDGIHRVLTFILAFNMCKCAPCAHRSNGYRGQRADWNMRVHQCYLVPGMLAYLRTPRRRFLSI